MSVWLENTSSPALLGTEGELVSVSITVQPQRLEGLLDTLARLDFPVNPQIYHEACTAAGKATLVEFPAYASRLQEVREALADGGFDSSSIAVRTMIEEIQSAASAAIH